MTILLTGSNGFFGQNILSNLSSEKFFTLNLTNADYICSLDKDIPSFREEYDLVIHAAGKAHIVPKTKEEIEAFHQVNVLGTINLLKGLEATSIPKYFVFISSVSVYGRDKGELIDENASLDAQDPYGKSKIEGEQIISSWCKQHGVVCTILRLPLLVGENPPGNLGSMIKGIKSSYYFNIAGGKAKKSMVLVSDVSLFIPKIAPIGGTYNLTDGKHPSFYELSMAIAKKYKAQKPKNLPLALALIMGRVGNLLGSKAPINTRKIQKIISPLTFDDTKAQSTSLWHPESVLDYFNR